MTTGRWWTTATTTAPRNCSTATVRPDFRGNKYSAFEGGTAVPFIASWPARIAGGDTSDALLSQIDLMASLGSLVKARLPQGSAPDSRDHLATIVGTDRHGRDYVLGQSNTHVLSVQTAKWRYIEPSDGPKMITWGPKVETGNLPQPQLYDRAKSRYEQDNVATAHPEVVYELQNILRRERAGKAK